MKKKYQVTLSTKPEITIHDTEKLGSVVVDNKTGWCNTFNQYSDIVDFIDAFSYMFFVGRKTFEKQENGKYEYEKFIEGFGTFIQNVEGIWLIKDKETIEEFGQIEVYFDNDADLEVDWSANEIN